MLYVRFISPPYFAFNKGLQRAENVLSYVEHIPFPYDKGYEVHADIILDGMCYSAVGTAPGPCVLKGEYVPNPRRNSAGGEELVSIPVTNPADARKYLEKAAEVKTIQYKIPFFDFVTPFNAILDYTDPDLDCDTPKAWPTMFCSQFVLLFLRHCHKHGIIEVPTPRPLYTCNSHVCSPGHLREIMRAAFDQVRAHA